MILRTRAGLLLVSIPLSLASACSDDSEDATAEVATDDTDEDASADESTEAADAGATVVSEEVDASGATLRLDTLVLIIPAGAIEDEQEVTLRLSDEGSDVPSAPYSKRYDIEPTELTLAVAATVEIEVSGSPTYPVLVVHVPGEAATLIAGEVVDGKFTAPIEHFGSIYLADAAELAQSEEFANDAIVIGLVGVAGDASVGSDAGAVEQPAEAGVSEDTSADAQVSDTSEQLDAGVSDAAVSVDTDVSPDTDVSSNTTELDAG